MPTEVSPLVLARESNDELPESTPPTSLDYRWHPNTIYLIIINVIGIVGILTSYGATYYRHPEVFPDQLWGGAPDWLKLLTAINLPAAAIGYIIFTIYLILKLDPDVVRIRLFGLKFDHRYFLLSYLVLLVAQMLWMPITARHIVRGPKKMPFAAIALDLTISSIAALALTLGVWCMDRVKTQDRTFHWVACLATVPFVFLAVVVDGILWLVYFQQ